MEVILIERMKNLGNIGDKVRVKNGYARNFLIPQKKALRVTKDNVAFFESKRAEIVARNDKQRSEAEKNSKTLAGQSVVIIRQASDDGRLYGSVTARDIAAALNVKSQVVDRSQVEMGTVIKEIGIYPVKLVLHPEVIVEVKANVARSESEAEAAAKGKVKKADKVKSALELLEEEEAARVAAEAEQAPAEASGEEDAA